MSLWAKLLVLSICCSTLTAHKSRNLVLGGAINVFKFFGDLSVTMRVDPRNDSDPNWLFREPISPVFQHNSKRLRFDDGKQFKGNFGMELCDDLSAVFEAYFRDIDIEGLERPWEAFTKSWTSAVVRNKLGIPERFQSGEYGYVFVRLSHQVESAVLSRHKGLTEEAKSQAASVSFGSTSSVLQFIRNFGSHYVSSYAVGNSLFQVLVYSKGTYENLKVKLEAGGMTRLELDSLFLPFYSDHVGPLMAASGSAELMRWASNKLATNHFLFTNVNLLDLYRRPRLMTHIRRRLGPDVLVRLKLRALGVVFKDADKREWFKEVSNNHLKLYESNV